MHPAKKQVTSHMRGGLHKISADAVAVARCKCASYDLAASIARVELGWSSEDSLISDWTLPEMPMESMLQAVWLWRLHTVEREWPVSCVVEEEDRQEAAGLCERMWQVSAFEVDPSKLFDQTVAHPLHVDHDLHARDHELLMMLQELGLVTCAMDVGIRSAWLLTTLALQEVVVCYSLRSVKPCLDVLPCESLSKILDSSVWSLLVTLHRQGWTMQAYTSARKRKQLLAFVPSAKASGHKVLDTH